MKAAETRHHTEPFLPDITAHLNRGRKTSQHSRMKENPQAGSVLELSPQILSRVDISKFRNSLKLNTCVELLQEGCHRSFSELHSLLSCDRDRRESAEPGTALSLQTPLEDQKDKIQTMRHYLSRAEQAERTNTWTVACEHRLSLGRYFSSQEDLWLSLHFYHSCVDREFGGHSRPATEARVCLAELYLQTGELERAEQQAELCIQQAEDRGWLDSDGLPLRTRGLKALWRIYSRMADLLVDAEEYSQALELLHKGRSMAGKIGDTQLEADATYQLGLTNQRAGDHQRAKQMFSSCTQVYGTLEDDDGLVKSYRAMARSLESEGNIDETVQCLQKLADLSQSSGLRRVQVDSYLWLGKIYYKRGQYTTACDFFQRGYEAACELGDVSLLEEAEVFIGTARAHCVIRKHIADIASAAPTATHRPKTWEETGRLQDFSGDSTDLTDTAL
ncbi:tetratricopeptide repeat protein 29 [Halichoeres trimaculatus]|uniref:tetratricopeptide repeat protein 29 n=1 Tax=Halichoeres trimaculatus TaxID=147232 RepID=UPI003D9F73C5